jgi:hypothetical protein
MTERKRSGKSTSSSEACGASESKNSEPPGTYLGDSWTIPYMWACLADAMREFDSQILTLPASKSLERQS